MAEAWEQIIDSGEVLLRYRDGIAEILLNRPEASNGMTVTLLSSLYEVVMRCHGDARVRVVVLRGAGRNFCAGGDIKDFAAKGEGLPDYLRQATSYLQIVAGALIRLNAVVITSVQGFAAGGGGVGLVCASDFVIAGEGSKFLTGATRAGMAPDGGSSVTLQRLVGLRKAMDMLIRNPIVTAPQALEMGLITTVVADDALEEETFRLAEEIAAGAPLALAATKRLLWNGVGSSVEAAFPEEARTVSELSGTADAREALAAVIERRKPTFIGR